MVALAVAAAGSGTPRVRTYRPPTHPQYWAIAQDSRGVLYFGNGDGLIEFDGSAWRGHRLPGRGAVRSLAVGGDGRIYVGGQEEFGYFDLDERGDRSFVSLRDRVAEEDLGFGDVWKTHALGDEVIFQSFERLFRWRGGELRSWAPETAFHFSYQVRGELYVLERGRGLLRLRGDRLEPVAGSEAFGGDRLYAMLPFGEDRTLLGFRERGLVVLEDGRFEELSTPLEGWLAESELYHGALLPDGGVALATLHGGVAALARDGTVAWRFNATSELGGRRCLYAFPDRDAGLWIALEGELARVDLNPALNVVSLPSGDVLELLQQGERLVLGTSKGLLVLDLDRGRPVPPARPIAGVRAQVLALETWRDQVLVASAGGLFLLDGERSTRLTDRISTVVLASRLRTDRVYVGEIDGLRILERRGASWTDLGSTPAIGVDVRTIQEASDGRLWLGTKSSGVLRVSFDATGDATGVEQFGPRDGLPPGDVNVWRAGGVARFVGGSGVFRWIEARRRFEREPWSDDPSLSGRLLGSLWGDRHGRIWITSRPLDPLGSPRYGLHLFDRDGRPAGTEVERLLQRLSGDAIFQQYEDEAGTNWLATERGLVRVDLEARPAASTLVPRPICDVELGRRRAAVIERPLDHDDGTIRARCSLPAFADERRNEFRFRLLGWNDAWTDWSTERSAAYTGLRPGEYVLEAQARDADGRASDAVRQEFEVAAPWYARPWFAFAVALALAGGAVAFHRSRTRRLEIRRRELERLIGERTAELRRSEREYRLLFENAADTILALDADGVIVSINPAGEALLADSSGALCGRRLEDLLAAEDLSPWNSVLEDAFDRGESRRELRFRGGDGETRILELRARALPQQDGASGTDPRVAEIVARDVTERLAGELRRQQARTLESVGLLAGGVAHDFNSLLTVIGGYSDLLLETSDDVEVQYAASEIAAASRSAARLTAQLLAYSRRQILRPERLDLNALVAEHREAIEREIGGAVELRVDLESAIWPVWADPRQLGQVLLSLVSNARAAMPAGGRLVIETRNATVPETRDAMPEPIPRGEYAVLVVRDQGVGMDAATAGRVFEPFFSASGRLGAGLGLATSFGIVRQSGGYFDLQTKPGAGSSFEIFFPRSDVRAPATTPPLTSSLRGLPSESILVCDDEEPVRRYCEEVLRRAGYSTVPARDAAEALEIARARADAFDLLVTDIVMPGENGLELAHRLVREGLCGGVLFLTGYSRDLVGEQAAERGWAVLTKPFRADELLRAVRRALRPIAEDA